MSWRDGFEEIRELGLGRALFRATWEFRMRSGLMEYMEPAPLIPAKLDGDVSDWVARVPFADPCHVAEIMRERISQSAIGDMVGASIDACRGRILCFGRWKADYGVPIDWQLNPISGERWPDCHWSKTLREAPRVGDIKLTWEVARFPHAYHMARACAFVPDLRISLTACLSTQIEDFLSRNPHGSGVHWYSDWKS
jgi:hypothetical protein